MEQDFANKVALVTGAGSGIGAAIARELATRGAKIVAADVDRASAEQLCSEIRDGGGTAQTLVVDVSDPVAVQAMVDFAVSTFGGLHLAVNNAGIGGPSASVADYPLDGWERVIGVNLNSVFFGLKYEIAAIDRTGAGGAIVNMSSILGSVGFANACAYVTAKHGLLGLTKVAAMEVAARNIRVNAVAPGFIETPMVTKGANEEVLRSYAALHPIGRLGTPAEVSALTCFLLSDRASFITGSCHLVDGGYVAR